MNQHAPIQRRSLHDELVTLIRDMIIAGELKPGAKVPEAELCARFGVSRTPLREALKVLAADGLLVLLPNRGAMVAKITPGEIEQLFPIMGMLEALAGELACQRLTPRDLAELESMHAEMIGHFEREDWIAYSKLNRAIHEKHFAIAGNESLAALYQQLMVRIHAVRFVARKTRARWAEAVADHEQMMAALRAKNGPALATILRDHLRHKADVVHEALRQLDATGA
jgi:DNA-binding GntR family transcriptional regulator